MEVKVDRWRLARVDYERSVVCIENNEVCAEGGKSENIFTSLCFFS